MGKYFIREELTAQDLKEFQLAKCIVINPKRDDIVKLLAQVQKRCRKNIISPSWAQRIYDEFMITGEASLYIGDFSCHAYFHHPEQGTIFQLIRLADGVIGLICDRQEVLPGCSAEPPIDVPFEGIFSGDDPLRTFNEIMSYFWPFLSDEHMDAIYQQCTSHVLGRLLHTRNEDEEADKAGHEVIKKLACLGKPKFTSEFAHSCQNIASNIINSGSDAVSWKQIKQQYPGITNRYKPYFVGMVRQGKVSLAELEAAKYTTNFDCRITIWEGESRIFNVPQLVLQIRNIPLYKQLQQAGGFKRQLTEHLKTCAKNSEHPCTEHTIGWLRVHLDIENRLCFVDEVQSDALEMANELKREPNYKDAVSILNQNCDRWHMHAFATISHWAESMGFKAAIHSRESAAELMYMTRSERKWRVYYESIIKQFGLRQTKVSGYSKYIYVAQTSTISKHMNR